MAHSRWELSRERDRFFWRCAANHLMLSDHQASLDHTLMDVLIDEADATYLMLCEEIRT